MKFRFDANQDFQLHAISAVVDLFEGMVKNEVGLEAITFGLVPAIPNRLGINEKKLLANLRKVQQRNSNQVDDELELINREIETVAGIEQVAFTNFSVEMETGTGKTYVYLRTILDLNKQYGMSKFIVVVPSIAIREGVIKNLEITKEHFSKLYSNCPYKYYQYRSDNLSQVQQFVGSSSIEIMVMTIDSFNKALNIIYQPTDRLHGNIPIHMIQAARPILILDEPQNMESEKTIDAIAQLNPLFVLRYSATHRKPYNVVYQLTPMEAYRQRLVKRIEVAGVEETDQSILPFIKLVGFQAKKKIVSAKLVVHRLMRDSTIRDSQVTVRIGDNLKDKTNRSEYADYTVAEINAGGGFVLFSNGTEVGLGEAKGVDKEAVWESQIRYTIQEHFRKQKRFASEGIKIISLFFIDRVDNYDSEEGIIRLLFNKCFDEIKTKYDKWKDKDSKEVQTAYFAKRTTRKGEEIFIDSKTGKTKQDEEAFNLIMRDKERLLSFNEPVAFIFSHSALREGWDNPNVFQICTLNQTRSEIKKRQEIGRGIRLAVNQDGQRIHEDKVNVLTVIANESYEQYVSTLQTEYALDYSSSSQPPAPANARKRNTAKLVNKQFQSADFKELWDLIKHKTSYTISIDTKRLIDDVVSQLDEEKISKPQIKITKVELCASPEDNLEAIRISEAKSAVSLEGRYPLPNLVYVVEDILQRTSHPVSISRNTILEIFQRTTNKDSALQNPYDFALAMSNNIKNCLSEQLVENITYQKIGESYDTKDFDPVIDSWSEHMVPAKKSIYSGVIVDSNVERQFVEDMEIREDVRLYVKLPPWFLIPTPIGNYNPDWTIVMDSKETEEDKSPRKLYLVRETKGTKVISHLRPDESKKVRCAIVHFRTTLGVDYDIIVEAKDLP